jgi:potassium-transporting ATPase KdpC subunit
MWSMIGKQLRPAIGITAALIVLTGLVYPGVVTALSQLLFRPQANGSLIGAGANPVGSALIGQSFSRAEYFHSRPSAAGAGYDATASAGTNKGPTDRKLADTLIARAIDSAVRLDGVRKGGVPSDMVTASGSGLDPHISPANAFAQVERVAKARNATVPEIQAVVAEHLERRQFGFLGDPRVNVLLLNLDLDRRFPLHSAAR